MKTKNKKLLAVLLIFALVLIVGGVYAALSGILSFEGEANLGEIVPPDKDLLLELWENNTPMNASDAESSGTMKISEDRQTAYFTVDLNEPGSEVIFSFDVRNVGTVNAYLYDFNYNSDTHPNITDIIEFTGTYVDMENQIVDVGGEIPNLTFGIRWKEGAEDFSGETVGFLVSILYDESQF